MNITLDSLMKMKSQCIGCNKDLVKEFAKVRDKLLKKGFNKLTFENTEVRRRGIRRYKKEVMTYGRVSETL